MKCFVEGPEYGIYDLLRHAIPGLISTNDFRKADIIALGGGCDVDPELYGEDCRNETSFNVFRDKVCIDVYKDAVRNKKKIIGICRGAQFISVMLGGKLWQHIAGHPAIHAVEGGMLVNSFHHQGIKKHDGITVVHTAPIEYGSSFSGMSNVADTDMNVVETFTAPNILCVQWHPEFLFVPHRDQVECVDWFCNEARHLCN